MTLVLNKDILLQNAGTSADLKAREAVLSALETAVHASNPRQLIRDHVKIDGSWMSIDSERFDLNTFKSIFVIGGGKASGSMAEALEQLLKDKITSGIVNVLAGTSNKYRTVRIGLNEASHPIPDPKGVKGTKEMLEIVECSQERDLIICLISGGGSAMMTLPREGVDLEDKQTVTRLLLRCGATINEINTVRKHLSEFKGGWLAKKAQPATLLSLILSDVVGDPLDSIASGPTAPDPTTYDDATEILSKYRIWDQTPIALRNVLEMGKRGLIPETPKPEDPAFKNVKNIIVGNNRGACMAAEAKLRELGFNTLFLTSHLQGEAREAGIFLAAIANEIIGSGKPIKRPAAVIVGGETTVTVTGNGLGGRNQETMLSAAIRISSREGVSMGSIGTDGIDGPTDAAGAIVDGKTMKRAHENNLDYKKALSNNDSYSFFANLRDLVVTGPTGSNVNDIAVLCVTNESAA